MSDICQGFLIWVDVREFADQNFGFERELRFMSSELCSDGGGVFEVFKNSSISTVLTDDVFRSISEV